MYNILVCDDEKDIVSALTIYLTTSGYQVFSAYDGTEALALLEKEDIHLVLLDIMMPQLDGIATMTRLREKSNVPVILLTAKSEDTDKILGLNVGADDYVTKPFRPVVLGAKVKALLRRSREFSSAASQQLRCGPFRYDGATMRFFKGEEVLDLSSREGALLLLFLQHPNQVFTKDMLYERVWGTAVAVDDNAIMVYINRLRGKIEPDRQHPVHIRTVRGLGYRFVP